MLRSPAPMSAVGVGRLVDVEQLCRAHERRRGRALMARRSARRGARARRAPAPGRATPAAGAAIGCERRQRRARSSASSRARTAPAPAAARSACRQRGCSSPIQPTAGRRSSMRAQRPGMQRRMRRRDEARAGAARAAPRRRPSTSKKSTARSRCAPLQRVGAAVGERRQRAAAGATPATRRARRREPPASRRNTRPISNTRTRDALRARLWRSTLHQAAEQARAHHRQRRGDRVQHADRVGVAGQLVLPALFDEAEVDRLLVVERGQQAAQRVRRCGAPRQRARAVTGASGGVSGSCR